MVKFNKFFVSSGPLRARVFYSLDNRTDGRRCVTLYARDYSDALGVILAGSYINDTEIQTDYFGKGRAVLFESHPLYPSARARAEQLRAARMAS